MLMFLIERTIINSFPILSALIIGSLFLKGFLRSLDLSILKRVFVYAVPGVAGGLLAYSSFDIPDRSIEALEAISLGLSMYAFSLLMTAPVVCIYSRIRKKNTSKMKIALVNQAKFFAIAMIVIIYFVGNRLYSEFSLVQQVEVTNEKQSIFTTTWEPKDKLGKKLKFETSDRSKFELKKAKLEGMTIDSAIATHNSQISNNDVTSIKMWSVGYITAAFTLCKHPFSSSISGGDLFDEFWEKEVNYYRLIMDQETYGNELYPVILAYWLRKKGVECEIWRDWAPLEPPQK